MPHEHDHITPYNTPFVPKTKQVAQMFDQIAPRYDRLNDILSFRVHKKWRKEAALFLRKTHAKNVLDIATGTGDFAIEILRRARAERIIGVDISQAMLVLGQEKIKKLGYEKQIHLRYGDSEKLPFSDGQFDAVSVAFGVRNFAHLKTGLSEIRRVLKADGHFVVLEFSRPTNPIFRVFYNFYSTHFIPLIGKIISRDRRAYDYLDKSARAFPSGADFVRILEEIGFLHCAARPLTGGICTLYTARK